MPTSITPVSAWTTPLQTPAGSDVANAASVENAVQRLADRIEYLKDKALGSTSWPASKVVYVAGAKVVGTAFVSNEDNSKYVHTNGVFGTLDITEALVTGAVLTRVYLNFVSNHSSSAGMELKLYKQAMDGTGVTQLGATWNTTTGTGHHTTGQASAISETVDRSAFTYFLLIKSSDACASGTPGDVILGAGVESNIPGPRSF